ncbi:MAG: MHYT domain-containing protein [Pseudomonadota bacterium]
MQPWWQRWFAWRDEAGPLAPVVYDPGLVALSLLIACAGGVAALLLVNLARHPQRFGTTVAHGAYGLAALTLGVSVWAMHFIGMLAADLCQPVRYEPGITALSVLPSVVASAIGLRLYARRERPNGRAIALAGLWVGAGIGAMHYSGMLALRIDSALRYDPLGFALSIVVAVALAMAGLGAREWLRRHSHLPGWAVVAIAGCLLGLATSGMHYTAMQASLFIGPFDPDFPRGSNRQVELALTVAAAVVTTFGFAWGLLGIASYRALALRLREREALLTDILNHLPGAIVRLRAGGDFERLLVSPSLAELTGRPLHDYLQQRWSLLDLVHPDDRPMLQRVIPQQRPTHYQTELQLRLQHATRGWRHVRVRAVVHDYQSDARGRATPVPVLDLYLTDVTAEHEVRAREQALLAAIDQVVGRAVLSPDAVFVDVNAKLAQLLGYEPAELIGQPHRVVWADDTDASTMAAFWAALRSGQAQPGDFVRRTKDGRTVHLSGWYQPLFDDNGRVQSVLKLAFDITDRVRMVQALQRTQDELQRALASRSVFFANVSHEIRTPMNAIVGFAELLRERLPADSPEREQARLILESARGLLRILNDVLDAAKLERGEFRIAPAPFRLDRLLHDLVSQFGVLAARKGLNLRLQQDPQGAACRHGDADRIRQILANLLGNAIKFTERGSVTLGAAPDDAGATVQLWVEDTGIGIPPERQQAIFDPFVQADAGTARRYGGTGLGMSIVRRLAELMGGEVALHSTMGVGTRVEVRLPLPALPAADCDDAPPPALPADAVRPLQVLAADDVAQNRELLAQLLARDGHEATVEPDGATLLARYQTAPHHWDLVLLDLHMPGLDGPATCAQLRAWERAHGLPPVPVWALSASVLDDDRAAAQRAGMDGFLEKPIDPSALRHVLAEAARRRAAAPAAATPAPTDAAPAPQPRLVAGPTAASASQPTQGPPPVADAARGHALWGSAWLAQLRAWVAEQAPRWAEAARWGREDWHGVAGTAANLALPALAAAARAQEHACARGAPADPLPAMQAWQAVLDWLAQHSAAASPPGDAPAPLETATPPEVAAPLLPEPLRQTLENACRRGEIPSAALETLAHTHPAQALSLRQALDAFDFDAALALLQRWRGGAPLAPDATAGAPTHD